MRLKLIHLAFAGSALAAVPAFAQTAVPDAPAATAASLQAKAAQSVTGRARVIVQLNAAVGVAVPEASQSQDAALASQIRSAGSAVAADVLGAGNDASYMSYSPTFVATATADEIGRLARDPRVKSVVEDELSEPYLIQSLKIIKIVGTSGTDAHDLGFRGAGRVVAVLDTGVNKNHEFLSGKVVSEACYSTTNAAQQSTSLCPGGAASSTASNSGLDCPSGVSGCGHGTHVAGIAAGSNTSASSGEPTTGVARSASILAIKVFSQFTGSACGSSSPCVLSYTSDQIKALERVYALRNGIGGRKIDAVNMSLGGGGYTGFCNGDSRKPIIDMLRSAGIATVIASGNSGYINGVGAPGCIQTAVTVGSSTKSTSSRPERMSSFTNQGPQVDMLAPGGDFDYPFNNGKDPILSSRFSGYAYLAGTSMAAPHVAGAFAVIRSAPKCATKSVPDIASALASTGPLLTDHRIVAGFPQLRERRIDVMAAMRELRCL